MEEFALASDRTKVLEQLIPGTEERSYYECLHLQHQGRWSDVKPVLDAWIGRHGRTSRVQEIEARQALLRWEKEPDAAIALIRERLRPDLNHERDVPGQKTNYPTALDPARVTRAALVELAFDKSGQSNLGVFKDTALEELLEHDLDGDRRRALLERLTRPDHPTLVKRIHEDLAYKHSGGFGSLGIHRLLTDEQLDALAGLNAALLQNQEWVFEKCKRLRPGPDTDWETDPAAREAYLERLWRFVGGLAPAFNSLKAHVLYHRLVQDRARGVFDRGRFLDYVKLPRATGYTEPAWLKVKENKDWVAQLGMDYRHVTLLSPVSDDEPLVRDCLAEFFVKASDWRPFDTYIRDGILKPLFATTKILAGEGDQEQWYSLLNDPTSYQALKEQVEIELAPTNKQSFGAGDAVTLDVSVKNVPQLVVKVFEINALNYLLAHGREPDTAIDLDGLVASEQTTHSYAEPPLRRVRRTLPFPSLKKGGVFVIELIGNGKSSRALVRKGRLRYLERLSAAGHVFTVLDDAHVVRKDASIWLGGREYAANGEGTIAIPYSTAPRRQPIILRSGDLATAETFWHLGETYTLDAGLHIDRESLIAGKQAQVVVRTQLLLNSVVVALELLREVHLTLHTTDRHGTLATKKVPLDLDSDRETIFAFQVPEDLSSLTVVLSGNVESVSLGTKTPLSASRSYAINQIDQTDATEDLHLSLTDAGYVVSLLGKTGEPRADRPVSFMLTPRDFTLALDEMLQTDEYGRIVLGHLDEIESFTASTPAGLQQEWTLRRDSARIASIIHVRAGEPLALPYMGESDACERATFALLERCGEGFLKDHFAKLKLRHGFLEVAPLTPGDYELSIKDRDEIVGLQVTAGQAQGGWLLSDARLLETRPGAWLQVVSIEDAGESLEIQLANATRATRVHVVATRFVPAHSLEGDLGAVFVAPRRALKVTRQLSQYVSGRELGDEYRYVLDRKLATKFPGNLLARPGLLLNPWAMRKTETDVQAAAAGGAYAAYGSDSPMASLGATGIGSRGGVAAQGRPNLDFLPASPTALWNLLPDSRGVVRIPRSAFAHASEITVLALSGENAIVRTATLPEVSEAPADRRLLLGLDPERHYTEKKQVSVLEAGGALEIADITTSRVEAIDTLARVHALQRTISGDTNLDAFSFVLEWPRLSAKEKGSKLSEFACHELHFFIARKDPAYFAQVVAPYLRNKRAKTFLDHYLLGDDLSGYLRPWAHGRLNVVERILLADRIASDRPATARHVADLNDMLPRDLEAQNRLFQTALQGSALDDADPLGFGAAAKGVEREMLAKSAGPGGGGAHAAGRSVSRAAPPTGMAFKAMAAPAPAAAMPPPSPKSAKRRSASESMKKKESRDERADLDDAFAEPSAAPSMDMDSEISDLSLDLETRSTIRPLYRNLETTQELGENNYYKCVIEQQGPDRVTVNAFWRDLARHEGKSPFLSPHFAQATRNLTEMMFALSVLDLPFERTAPGVTFTGARMKLEAKRETVVFHKEIKPATPATTPVPVLVSQNYFRADDRTRVEDGEDVDKYVTGEMLVHTVYVAQIVLTNPTSTQQKLDILLQIPCGAMPVSNGFKTKGETIALDSYSTHSIEYAFYFPAPGTFAHYPVHVSKDEALVASAPPRPLTVVLEPSTVDRTSWAWVSQQGTTQDLLRFLGENAIERYDLDQIAWRMRDRKVYDQVLALLERRHVYSDTLWAYSVHHGDAATLREYLLHQDSFLRSCGLVLDSPVISIDPVRRGWYEHREYAPLVNARAHKLGARRKILNDRFANQYAELMQQLTYKSKLGPDDLLSVTYYLMLQDRVAEALATFAQVDREKIAARLQYDYLRAYLTFYGEDPRAARAIASPHAEHAVDRWRNLFRNVLAQLNELEGTEAAVVDPEDRSQKQEKLASTEATLEIKVENKTVELQYQNVSEARVNYYLMDIELLFSRQPFVQQQTTQFSFVKPNRSDTVRLPAGQATLAFGLPTELHGSNVVVEVTAGGQRRAQAYYAHALRVTVVEPMGQLRVVQAATGKPLARTYVKAYARAANGKVKFYKDGYTDLRGRFDYASISTHDLDGVERFAVLVLSDEHGSVIREAEPPKR